MYKRPIRVCGHTFSLHTYRWSLQLPALPLLLLPLLLPSLPLTQPAERGRFNIAWAFNAQLMACTNALELLSVFVEWVLSLISTNGGRGGDGTITRSPLMQLAGTGRVNSVNYSTCLHRLARVVASPVHDDLSLDRRYSAVIGTDCRHWY